MPNYQDCHIFQRDKSQTSGADKVPVQRIQTSGPQLSLGVESGGAFRALKGEVQRAY